MKTNMNKLAARAGAANLGLLAAFLLAAPAAVTAAEPDFSSWKCESCPFADGWKIDTEAGGGTVSDDSAKFGDYTGLDDDGGYAIADADLRYWSGTGYTVEATGENLGLDSRSAELEAGKQGLWEASLFYDKIPRSRFDDTETVFRNTGSPFLTLPAGWVRGGSTGGMTQLDASLKGEDIEWDRETVGAGLGFLLGPRWDFSADYSHQERSGNRLFAGTFYTSSSILPAELDYNTDQFEGSIGYTADDWHLRLGAYLSQFNNKTWAQSWENPFAGTDVGRAAAPPDNNFLQYSLTGGYNFPLWRTVLSGSLAYGTAEQDDGFLAYTVNPAIATSPLPRPSYDGEVDVTNASLRLTSSPWSPLRLKAEYRYDDRDNGSPSDSYEWVRVDSFAGGTAVNTPYSFTRDTVDLEATARLDARSRVIFGYRYDSWDRDDQERDTDTNRYWAKFSMHPGGIASFSMTAGRESRGGSDYEQVDDGLAPQNPLMRKYNMAGRDRDDLEFRLNVTPGEDLSLGLAATWADETYASPANVGLREVDYVNYSFDGDYALSKKISLYALYSYEKYNARQQGSSDYADPNWSARSRDQFDTAIVGLRFPQLIERLDVDVDYTYAKSEGRNRVAGSGYPDLENDRKTLRVTANYAVNEALSVKAGWWYEDYSSDDWALDGIEPATMTNLLSLGQDAYDYDVNVVMLSFSYSWDALKEEEE